MNNIATTTLTIAAILAATLVVGVTFATTTQSALAVRRGNGNDNGNTDTDQIAKQKAYVSGFDNSFNQELQNLICTHPSASCTVEQTPTPPPPPPPSDDDDGEDRHDDPKKMDDMSKYW